MLAIGLYGYKTSTADVSGYMLGGRKLGPGVTALSAGASDMSGWMLLGVPGAMYLSGISSAWIAVGLLIGAYVNYLIVAPRLRVYTEVAHDAITLPDYFEKRFADKTRLLRVVSSVVIVIFFTLYTSSGVVGGGKLFESSFGLSYELGLYVTAGVVVAYTLFGGFMAVSITDFVQGCIMFVALVLVPLVAVDHLGGFSSVVSQVTAVNANFIDPFVDANTAQAVSVLGIISLLSWGFGYFGQPHIIVRFMAIRSVKDIKAARRIGMSWMLITIIGAVMTGMVGIAYVANTKMTLADPETIFIVFSQFLFHPLISGFLLAAILAAIMSTISSQLLVTSSSLTEDFYKAFVKRDASQKELVLVGRLSVLAVALVAIALAYDRDSSILSLVSNAWAGFGAAFGPLVVLSLYWQRMTFAGALSGIISGAATVLFWIYAPVLENGASLSSLVYEIVPGVIISTLSIIIVSRLTKAPAPDVITLFERMQHSIKHA
ncbi:sodium/proline symporter PutP [Rheinheimera pleomorphica]|uniref:sodium/proline symporter PutP n=1 Tax=Rheinheimera pleomorphica TaxID=2703963 RepID=UPI001F510ABC